MEREDGRKEIAHIRESVSGGMGDSGIAQLHFRA